MKMKLGMIGTVSLVLMLTIGHVSASAPNCGLPRVSGLNELNELLSLRAVDFVERAASPKSDLAPLMSPSAEFSLGAGDVGRPLGSGIVGARKLAHTMNANRYRFLGWDYMDGPAEACARNEVEVEFIDSRNQFVSKMKFIFEGGRVVKADGWQRSFKTGHVNGFARPVIRGNRCPLLAV